VRAYTEARFSSELAGLLVLSFAAACGAVLIGFVRGAAHTQVEAGS